jgi:hypothetical protein
MIVGSETEPVNADSWEIVGDPSSYKDGTNIKNGTLTAAKDETAVKLIVKAAYNDKSATATVKVVATPDKNIEPTTTSIKEKFGITTAEPIDAVTETFTALHEFIKAGGLTNDKTKDMIVLGDWIDLEGGLTVDPYGTDTPQATTPETKGEISLNYSSSSDKLMLKLIVVGINSFQSGGENTLYAKTENKGVDHLVFQFQNIPGLHIMNPTNDNTGGYAASEMRKYLVPVYQEDGSELEGSGNFLAGLVNAGVPKDVLWGPTRYLSTKGKGNEAGDLGTLDDLLWLPTRFEMTGESEPAQIGQVATDAGKPLAGTGMRAETAENQVQLEYYPAGAEAEEANRKKLTNTIVDNVKNTYWLSSANAHATSIGFADVISTGKAGFASSNGVLGVAPAFCVW